MAKIAVAKQLPGGIDVYIDDLDVTYNGKRRTAQFTWWEKETLDNVQTGYIYLPNLEKTSDIACLSNMKPSTEYTIACTINGINEGDAADYSVTLSPINEWTADMTPYAEIRHIGQTEWGEKKAKVKVRFFDVYYGISTFQIEARKKGSKDKEWYPKTGEITITSQEMTEYIVFNELATYEIRVKVVTNKEVYYSTDDDKEPEELTLEESKENMSNKYGEIISINQVDMRMIEVAWKTYQNTGKMVRCTLTVYKEGEASDPDRPLYWEELLSGSKENKFEYLIGMPDYEYYWVELIIWVEDYNGNVLDNDFCYQIISVEPIAPTIEEYSCASNNKTITTNFICYPFDKKYSTYKVRARKAGISKWDDKINADFSDYTSPELSDLYADVSDSFEVGDFGTYEIEITVETQGISTVVYDSIKVVERAVELWQWDNTYIDSISGGNTTISPTAYVPVSTTGEIQPITARTWNGFTFRINELRQALGLSEYPFRNIVKKEEFTPEIYNTARAAIQSIGSGAGSLIPEMTNETELSAYIFEILRDELNSAIQNLT